MSKMFNRARMTITSTGTGALTLGVAVTGYQTFSSAGVSNGDTVSYTIEDGVNWECGTGVFTLSGTTLSRTVTQSYNGSTYGTSPISVTTSAQVFITALAADLQSGTAAGNLVALDGTGKLPAVDGSQLTGIITSPAGTSGQIQYNNSGSFGGFTVSGDGTLTPSTGALVITKTNGTAFAASATTDATNASNISSGTLNNARLSGVGLTGSANTFTASNTFNAATSSIYLGANSGNLGIATFYGSTSGSVTLKPAAVAGTGTIFQLPSSNGTSGYVLQTDGSGATSWVAQSGGGATGGGTDKGFWENDITITTNYTITTNKNAGTFGPITINSGATVTVPSGSVWTIV